MPGLPIHSYFLDLQPAFTLPLFPGIFGFYIFIHNKEHAYLPARDGVFGSYHFYKIIPDITKRYSQAYRLDRTHLKNLNTKNQPCDEGDSKPNTTTCITRHLEKEVGCSMGTYGSDPKIERYHFMNISSCTFNQLCILGAITSTK